MMSTTSPETIISKKPRETTSQLNILTLLAVGEQGDTATKLAQLELKTKEDEKDIKGLKVKVRELEGVLAVKEVQISTLSKKVNQLQEERDDLSHKYQQVESVLIEHSNLKQEYANLKQEYANLKQEHGKLKQQYRKLENENEELNKKVADLTIKVNVVPELEAAIEALMERIQNLEATIVGLKAKSKAELNLLENSENKRVEAEHRLEESQDSKIKRILGQVAFEFDHLVVGYVIPDYEDRAIFTVKQLTNRVSELSKDEQERWKKLQDSVGFTLGRHTDALNRLKKIRLGEAHPPLPTNEVLLQYAQQFTGKLSGPFHEIIRMYSQLPRQL